MPNNGRITSNAAEGGAELSEAELDIGILSAIHSLTRFNIGAILGDLSQMEFMVLYIISNQNAPSIYSGKYINVSSIANMLEVSTPAVSRLLRGLEERSLIERVTDSENRRNTYVRITEKGCNALKKGEKIISEFSVGITRRLGRDKIRKICGLSAELAGAVREELALISAKR